MAPQVPGLIPDQTPSMGGTPEVNLAVPTDAFGGAVGQALQHLGVNIEGASDKIWQQAMHLQELQNRTEVDTGDAEFIKQSALKHAEFNSQLGQNAGPEALKKHIEDIQQIRNNIKGTMSNPMSQKMFDSTSLSTLGRYVSNASNHSANEVKSAYRQGLVLRRNAIGNDLADEPDDPTLRDRFRAMSTLEANEKGLDPKDTGEYVRNSESAINLETVNRLSDKDPTKGKELIESYHSKKALMGENYDAAIKYNTLATYRVVPDQMAREVWNQSRGDDVKPELSEDAMVESVRKQAGEARPGDTLFQKHAEDAMHTLYTRQKQQTREVKFDAKQEIAMAIQNGAENLPMLMADPKTAAAVRSLDPKEQNGISGQINRYIKSRDYYDNQRSLTTLQGLSKNDVLQFLDTDPTDPKWKLSQPQIRTVMGWKAELQKNQNQDPQVNRAMSWLRGSLAGQLQALGVFHRDAKNPEDYDHFTGALSEALNAWKDAHGKPAESKDVTETIAKDLMRQHQVPGVLWGTNPSDPMFKDELTTSRFKAFKEDHIKSRVDQGESPPTNAETERLYYRGLAKTLYGKSK